MKPSPSRSVFAVMAILGVAACGRPAARGDDLSHDLDQASSANTLELTPTAGRTNVISAIERVPATASAPSRHIVAHRHSANSPNVAPVPATPNDAPTGMITTASAPAAPSAVLTPTEVVAPRPSPRSSGTGSGGYKSIGEVIRNAPFPINP